MSDFSVFNGWDNLLLSDLVIAYRKAKADLYFENSFPSAVNFAEYEQKLIENLNLLLEQLKKDKGFKENEDLLGECRLVPKKLGIKAKSSKINRHVHFSDSSLAFQNLCKHNRITPEFRIIGDFPVDMHVVSALWVNMIGHKFDSCLDSSSYGSRLRRIRNDDLLNNEAPKKFHITAVGSFVPYFQPYQRWRNDGLQAIRDELEKDKKVIAVSLDLKSYYHQLDSTAIASDFFQESIGLKDKSALSSHEKEFTTQLTDFLQSWSAKAQRFSQTLQTENTDSTSKVDGGLVIGLTASQIISNVLLLRWDKLIQEKITPIHYGRYVDDMFLVLRDPETINDASSLMNFLQERIGETIFYQEFVQPGKQDEESFWHINLGKEYQQKSSIQLQEGKQKLFILSGQSGCDLLDSIEKEISELSSEHRLMPSPDQLETSTAAKVLSAAGSVGEGADTLRRADGLTIQRLSWSLQLRHVETLVKDLPAAVWKSERDEFYLFAHNHILRPDNLFAHYAYLPRLLGFAISVNDWVQAELIVQRSFESLDQLSEVTKGNEEVVINGNKCLPNNKIWENIRASLVWAFVDAAAKYYDPEMLLTDRPSTKVSNLASIFMKQLWSEFDPFEMEFNFSLASSDFYDKAPLLALSDLARIPYKQILSSQSAKALLVKTNQKESSAAVKAFEETQLLDVTDLKQFLKVTKDKRLTRIEEIKRDEESLIPYLFPTRPYTPSEIAELAPECVGLVEQKDSPANLWAKYVRVLRGVWVNPTLLSPSPEITDPKDTKSTPSHTNETISIGTQIKKKVIVAIINLKTSEADWAASACNQPNLSLSRYKRISELVNQAISLKPRPDYLIFPELSLPLQWVNSISNRLIGSGVSLIAGTEYRHSGKDNIVSEACLVLKDNRLGYPASVIIWQPKKEPSVGEDKELTAKFGKSWVKPNSNKRQIYKHNGFHFGVAVCSEITNIKTRSKFQGCVDALMILAWNKDLDSFSALVEATALDVHAYTILVNNRKYGDSRVRSPSKESFKRDLARLRGGENDFCVTVELDIEKLRAFQSRAKRWPEETDPFKPVPEGFELSEGRKVKPPK